MGTLSARTGLGMQFQTKCTNDLEDRVEARATFPGKRLVEAFSGKPGVSGNLRHTLGAGDVAKRFRDKGGIAIRFFQARFEIRSHFLRGSEVFCNVMASGGDLDHGGYAERFRSRRKAALMSLA